VHRARTAQQQTEALSGFGRRGGGLTSFGVQELVGIGLDPEFRAVGAQQLDEEGARPPSDAFGAVPVACCVAQVTEDMPERVVLQFGKVSNEVFTMDCQWPISPLQAFAICISSFDSKLACE
jgi:hypothetical protein